MDLISATQWATNSDGLDDAGFIQERTIPEQLQAKQAEGCMDSASSVAQLVTLLEIPKGGGFGP